MGYVLFSVVVYFILIWLMVILVLFWYIFIWYLCFGVYYCNMYKVKIVVIVVVIVVILVCVLYFVNFLIGFLLFIDFDGLILNGIIFYINMKSIYDYEKVLYSVNFWI